MQYDASFCDYGPLRVSSEGSAVGVCGHFFNYTQEVILYQDEYNLSPRLRFGSPFIFNSSDSDCSSKALAEVSQENGVSVSSVCY